MKRMLALVLAMVMVLSLSACGGADGSSSGGAGGASGAQAGDDEKFVAYFVGVMAGGSVWGQAQAGFEAACEELGWEGYYVSPNPANDTSQMVNLVETALTNNADMIAGVFYSADIFGDVCGRAMEQGVHIVTTNCFMNEDLQDFWIGTDPVGMGVSQAKTLAEIAGDDEVTVVYLQSNATSETQNTQYAAFCDYLEDYPNITVFGQEFCNSQAIEASDKVANLKKANPEINAVVCADGAGTLGLGNFIEEQQLQDEFIGIGIDDGADMLAYVTSGALDCTIAQDFYKMGYESCMMLKEKMDGGEVAFDNDSGTIVIWPDEVESYAAEKGIELL